MAPLRSEKHERDHSPPLSTVAGFREGSGRARHQGARMALGGDSPAAAEARRDAADRRLSPHPGDAGRRRCLLRQPVHSARTGAPLSQTDLHPGWKRRFGVGGRAVDRRRAVRPRRQAGPRRRAGPVAGGVRPGPRPALSRPGLGSRQGPCRSAARRRPASRPVRLGRPGTGRRPDVPPRRPPGASRRPRLLSGLVRPRPLARRSEPAVRVSVAGGLGTAGRGDRPWQPAGDDLGRSPRHRPQR
jgi:hypothetical protein